MNAAAETARESLTALKGLSGEPTTEGLSEALIGPFLDRDPLLELACREALALRRAVEGELDALIRGPESALITSLQSGYVNFYPADSINPYVPLAARGPWVVTTHGAVIHDSGGYGMLGMGHGPQKVLDAMSGPYPMANVMTASLAQARLMERLKAEIGRSVEGEPYPGFQCLNSGSESVTLAMRISDINAALETAPGARHEGKKVRVLALEGGFHGRTDRPARASDSSRPGYLKHLRSHAAGPELWITPPNDIAALEATFARADAEGVFLELMLMEPVQGEGNPGAAATRAFYDAARRLTRAHGAMLLVDSVQAGLRATGDLSVVDYPGFEGCDPPDFETWSKALNAGQYPLSVLGLSPRAVGLFKTGVYGNTMTTNPRALEVACTVMDLLTPELRANIRDRGDEFVELLKALQAELPEGVITGVQGTGLLFSCELRSDIRVTGDEGVEVWLRRKGIGVIHGGENSLRFTPHFNVTSEEAVLMVELVRQSLVHFTS